MSNYTKSTNFATKDNLTPGDPLKVVRGTEIDTEYNNIATAIATKTDNASAAITGGTITGITDLAVADGGTGASTAAGALNNLLPSQTSAANKYLQSDGTNASWDAVTLSTADITGTLPVANGGTGVTSSTGTGNVVLSNSPTLVTPALGTPASGTATNLTGLPISTGVSGLGTGVATFLGTPSSANLASAVTDETGSGALVFANSPTLVTPALGTPTSGVLTNATGLPISTGVSGLGTGVATFLGTPSSANLASAVSDETGSGALVFANSPTLVTPALGTPSALVGTNITGTASGLTAGNVTTNANLTGAVTSVGNATSLGSFSSANLLGALTDETGTGSAVFATSPTLVTPILGTPTSATLTNATGLPIATGVSGLGTGVANFLATPSSANLAAALTDETGSGANVFATSPTLVTPVLGTPTSATLTNATGLPLTTGVTGTLPTANGGTNLTSFTSGGVVYASSTSALATSSAFQFNGTDLGLGVTPSVNTVSGSGYRQIEVGTSVGNMVFAGGNELLVVQNAIYNSGFKYAQSTQASYFRLNGGEHQFFTAPAGTAGNPVTFTQRMTLDASGNLGIGTTSPAYKLEVNATSGVIARFRGTGNYGQVIADNTSSTGGGVFIAYQNGTAGSLFGVDGGILGTTSKDTAIFNDVAGGSINLYTAGSATPRLSVNSAGGVKAFSTIGVGNATPSTSGAGITFPATLDPSSNANTLDDYEEGTWTPSLKFGGNNTGLSNTVEGKYTKVGNVVYWTCDFALSAKGSSTGSATITGLPFTSYSGTYTPSGSVWAYNMNSLTGAIVYRVDSGGTTINLYQYDSTGSNNAVTNSSFNNDSQNRVAGFYFIS